MGYHTRKYKLRKMKSINIHAKSESIPKRKSKVGRPSKRIRFNNVVEEIRYDPVSYGYNPVDKQPIIPDWKSYDKQDIVKLIMKDNQDISERESMEIKSDEGDCFILTVIRDNLTLRGQYLIPYVHQRQLFQSLNSVTHWGMVAVKSNKVIINNIESGSLDLDNYILRCELLKQKNIIGSFVIILSSI